ncbi:hypothetical protein UC35_12545 [Ramlibacter tataouinensis]|uniref:Outer membrane protein beta-barrel domain-containing protein n=1 Tax=Ramlibacter tataouinensis TaxID=94132 RepID=A0A127JU48_9BURK|nr:hypothetical protein UC35_12545 [Ramlibacter tataouinensis]
MLGSAQAQMTMPQWSTAGLYGELGYTQLKIDAFGTSLRPGAIRGIIGYDFHPFFAVEAAGAWGIDDDDKGIAIGGVPTSVQAKLDYMYGLWVKPKYAYQQFEFFGRLGYAHTKVEVDRTGFIGRTEGQDDFAWGLGANYRFTPNAYVGIDWMRYSNQSNSHVDGLTIYGGWHW